MPRATTRSSKQSRGRLRRLLQESQDPLGIAFRENNTLSAVHRVTSGRQHVAHDEAGHVQSARRLRAAARRRFSSLVARSSIRSLRFIAPVRISGLHAAAKLMHGCSPYKVFQMNLVWGDRSGLPSARQERERSSPKTCTGHFTDAALAVPLAPANRVQLTRRSRANRRVPRRRARGGAASNLGLSQSKFRT